MEAQFQTPVSINEWTVDYGDGTEVRTVHVPHAWQQDVPLAYQGPVVYRTKIVVPRTGGKLRFYGVSYAAEVSVNGRVAARHEGIWDAFDVPLSEFARQEARIEVRVVKNGGPTYPVREVASGFLPYVFHTFGGIFREVELLPADAPSLDLGPVPPRVEIRGAKLFVDGEPFYLRGLLHWGWYPDLGHPTPPDDTIREEVREAKALGFNLVKFCLWVPPQRYLEILREEGMEAWMELPLWDPSDDPKRQECMAQEMERIVRQYRRHDNILVWTVGCELSDTAGPDFRRYLTQMVRNLTRCPLVKDNSGGAEMYGGDLREFGDFYDFHPYADTPIYPAVLDTLLPGPRPTMPFLLGEFNDVDVHRDLALLADEMPYWASALPELNDQGVRWQYDLPRLLSTNRFSVDPMANHHERLMASSRTKALFMRKTVHEAVRARDAIGGYAITGWRDTPISSSGFFDDWGEERWSHAEVQMWNGPSCLFLIPVRRPPWVHGGNRPGYLDPLNHFVGPIFWRVGFHGDFSTSSGLVWHIRDAQGDVVAYGASDPQSVSALESTEVGQIYWKCEKPGEYWLDVQFDRTGNAWPIWVVERPDFERLEDWRLDDRRGLLEGVRFGSGGRAVTVGALGDGVSFLTDEGTLPAPFWREAAYEFNDDRFWQQVPFAERWERLHAVSGDRVLDLEWLRRQAGSADVEVLMNRIDVRTYAEAPIVARIGSSLVTTLRPWGGLGVQPVGLPQNPAGVELLRRTTEGR